MKQKMKRFLGVLLSLAMIVGLMPGMSLTALAYDGDPYESLVNTRTSVKFNGIYWFIIADNSTAVNAGTVTLLAATPIEVSKFHDSSNAYTSSTVKDYLEGLTAEGGSFAGVADAIVATDLTDVSVTGAKLWLLSRTEADGLSLSVRVCGVPKADGDYWWLRSPGHGGGLSAMCVFGQSGTIKYEGDMVIKAFGVRPALKLNLSSVIFSSESMTFSLKPDEYEVTYKVVNGTWSDDSTTDKKETVQSGSKPASVPTGMKAAPGYTGGAWDTDPADATISEALTFTYTFTEKQAATVTKVTVNTKTVSAKAVNKAIKKAGATRGKVKTIVLGKNVKKIKKGAFKNCKKAKTLIIKTKKLKKSTVKNSLKGSKIAKVQVKVGSKKANKQYIKKYKKIFTKKIVGKKVKIV